MVIEHERRSGTRLQASSATSERIVIVGAGAAGLSAAHYLRAAGFTSVTLLEREDRVGGKCCTFQHQGRSYELGAAVISSQYRHVRGLMREMGIGSSIEPSGFFVELDTRQQSYLVPSPKDRNWLSMGVQSARYALGLLRRRRIWTPGFADMQEDLAEPFAKWAAKNGFSEVVALIKPWFTGFGYGYFEDIPAAYVLKYMTIGGFPLSSLLETGFQGLWEKVARRLDVQTGVDIQSIRRSLDGVVVETNRGTVEADRLILACPLKHAPGFLDVTPEERELFGHITAVDYRVYAANVHGLEPQRYTFCEKYLEPSQTGKPMFWYRRWLDRPLTTFYVIAGEGQTDDAIIDEIGRTVRALGGRVDDVLRSSHWEYFPHVDERALRAGFYERLEALQGKNRTHYVGELLAFPTVETVVAYSAHLVRRHFEPAAQGEALGA
jgi:predicted NAD/FAD-binding protein